MDIPIADLRREYSCAVLTEASLKADPLEQLASWLAEALRAQCPEANAMVVATVDARGQPSARVCLLKSIEPAGLVFYTNYHSRKGRELAGNDAIALCFWWQELARQVRIEGRATRVAREASDKYFGSRPRGSQLAACSSPQSSVVSSREQLEREFGEWEARFPQGAIPCPAHWGGYLVTPRELEFWQGRENRLHDRLRYRRDQAGQWKIERLAP